MKPIIGILPVSTIYKDDNENYYDEQYKFVNIYCKKIYEEGAIPVGILLNDTEIADRLNHKKRKKAIKEKKKWKPIQPN